MRINELIVESQQIDEISLAGIGKGIGKAANVAGKAVGGAVGGTVAAAKQFGSGVKQGYQGSKATVGGTSAPTQAATSAPATSGTVPAPSQSTTGTPTPATNQPAVKRNPNNPDDLGFGFDGNTGLPFKSQAERDAGLAKEKAAAAAQSTTVSQPASPAPLNTPPVVPGSLDGIKKAYSILDPNEKEQLKKDLEVIDDQDRLATGTNESRRVGMKSNFLGIDL
jgi:hypothetical protein